MSSPTSPPSRPPSAELRTLRRITVAAVVGGATFVASNMLQEVLNNNVGDQLIMAFLVGGVTLISQLLGEFSQAQTEFGDGLKRIERSSASRMIEQSALQSEVLNEFLLHAGRLSTRSPDLINRLAAEEVERVSRLLRTLGAGEEVYYDGEDREYLLALAKSARRSIVATSLVTVDAGGKGFEGGLWLTDLGARYLEIQRAAARRGVAIRRIFVFDAPEFASDPNFLRVQRLQREAGVDIRGIDESNTPERLKDHVSDFIVFDDVLAYETTRASRITNAVQPVIITTRLVQEKHRLDSHRERFEELWRVAGSLPDPDTSLQIAGGRNHRGHLLGSAKDGFVAEIDLSGPDEDIPDAGQSVGR
ncbi:hypothetical protein [Kineosporia succinea]|uniref:Phosphatidylserine/phosphatidylglycerophosphate/ cardiolipin synthase family protein n=1 Tax=Kineosporia succinea TaxID=84632 RepID=A0ABT9PE93_9ACTN|nr:hypothetical protein [Kineosporia succinea]MDP9830792.1 hypothetical protein [Kineosporia succinea]